MRGEHFDPAMVLPDDSGSSPRARGTHHEGEQVPRAHRVIPACAGNTPGRRPCRARRAGSSPRARGTHQHQHQHQQPGRVIPACAGNTRAGASTRPSTAGHPRVRGEHRMAPSAPHFGHGSSPRARGTLELARPHAPAPRVIPACAGNTGWRPRRRTSGTGHPRVRGEHSILGGTYTISAGSSPRARGTQESLVFGCDAALGHPRVRGEHSTAWHTRWGTCGSSPRARGTLRGWRLEGDRLRVIPACAGNTGAARRSSGWSPGHPRVRGEHADSIPVPRVVDGSSPRARGTPEQACAGAGPRRVIPACAGNTGTVCSASADRPGHPRVRGEHSKSASRSETEDGSSPRARGTPTPKPLRTGTRRVIPACAGNTARCKCPSPTATGHPRVRGEHCSRSGQSLVGSGSSPRARGTHHAAQVVDIARRVIPACAGNTWTMLLRILMQAGHPRVRGEHRSRFTPLRPIDGSSPRARGTPSSMLHRLDLGRVIPACAGNTGREGRAGGSQPGHPRVRGEHPSMPSTALRVRGSSPRARGTQPSRTRYSSVPRVIPACAGNTHPSDPASLQRPGSSPRARGTLVVEQSQEGGGRVIPACAGNTFITCVYVEARAGHPRVRGEHLLHELGQSLGGGSSPRARGTQKRDAFMLSNKRVIPACAGNTLPELGDVPIRAGHPRVRGEHALSRASVTTTPGSSPRARGTHYVVRAIGADRRVIPACAGNTSLEVTPHPAAAGHPRVRGEHGARSPSLITSHGSSPRARGTHS